MLCPSPIRLKNPNGGFTDVPCGKCRACIQNKRNNRACTLVAESLISDFTYFVTLTYDDENYFNRNLSSDICLFYKRLRSQLFRKNICSSFRYFSVSEKGHKTHRDHFHCQMFFNGVFDIGNFHDTIGDIVESSWSLGFVNLSPSQTGSIMYCTKYMFKSLYEDKSVIRMSSRPPLGVDYFINNGLILSFVLHGKISMPDGTIFTCPKSYRQYLVRNWSVLSPRIQASGDKLFKFVSDKLVVANRLCLPREIVRFENYDKYLDGTSLHPALQHGKRQVPLLDKPYSFFTINYNNLFKNETL